MNWSKWVSVGTMMLGTLSNSTLMRANPPRTEIEAADLNLDELRVAGERKCPESYLGLIGLIGLRLQSPELIDEDLAMEALLALQRQENTEACEIVRLCAEEDPSDAVRYLALETYARLCPHQHRLFLGHRAALEDSPIVRYHALELLKASEI